MFVRGRSLVTSEQGRDSKAGNGKEGRGLLAEGGDAPRAGPARDDEGESRLARRRREAHEAPQTSL